MRAGTRRALVLAAWLTAVLRAAVLSEDGPALIHKMQDALGGAEKIAAVRDFEETQGAESFDAGGNSIGDVRKRTRWIRPGYLRVDQVGPGSTYVLYFDGKSGWEILPGADKAVELTGGELKFAQGYVRGFFLLMWVSDGDLSHQLDYTLDPATWLPVKETFLSLSDPAHPVPNDKVFEEWITAGGVRFPSRFSVLRSGVRVARATSMEAIRINTGLKLDDLSARPADGKPVFSSSP